MKFYIILLGMIGLLLSLSALAMGYSSNYFYLSKHAQDWFFSFLLNLGSGIIASIVVIILYNLVLDKRSAVAKLKKQQIALSFLAPQLTRQLNQLYAMYKANLYNKPQQTNQSFEQFFNDDYFNAVIELDISKTVHPLDFPYSGMWYENISERAEDFNRIVNDILKKYAECLESDIIKTMNELGDCYYIKAATKLPEAFKQNEEREKSGLIFPDQFHPKHFKRMEESFRFFVINFLVLVNQYNSIVTIDSRISFDCEFWDNSSIAPGSNIMLCQAGN